MEVDSHQQQPPAPAKQQKLLNIRKEKSRDAARNRRSKENLQYVELAKLLPLPEAITSQLDKASVIRLTISFLKYREMTGREISNRRRMALQPVQIGQKMLNPYNFEKDLGLHLLQAMDGFIFCVSQEGKFMYMSETISNHLGLSQLDLIGSSVFNVIHPDDHRQFSELLCSTVTPSYDCMNMDDLDAMNFAEMMRRQQQGYISIFTRMKCALVKRGGCSVKSAGYKVIHISGQMVPFKNIDHNGERAVALVATGQPLPSPTMCELKLDTKVFVSRVGMDLKISFCEGKIRNYMNFTAKDIVGISAYEFYHLNDMTIVGDAHSQCLNGGKCISGIYRWMNKTGGWVRMQTVGTVITRNTPNGEETQILCVNYIWSEVEHDGEIIHSIQEHFSQLSITDPESQKDTLEDCGTEVPGQVTSDDVKASLAAATAQEDDVTGEPVFNKESYILALQYKSQMDAAAKAEAVSNQPLDGLAIPSINDQIPSWQESQKLDEINALGTHQLLAELEMQTTAPLKYPFEDAMPNSPDSGLCDMSPIVPSLHNVQTKSPQDVYMMKATSRPADIQTSQQQQQDLFFMNAFNQHLSADMLQPSIDLNMTTQNIALDIPPQTEQQMVSPPGYSQFQQHQMTNTMTNTTMYSMQQPQQQNTMYTQQKTTFDHNQNPSSQHFVYNQFSTTPQQTQAQLFNTSNISQQNMSIHNTNNDNKLIPGVQIKQEEMSPTYDGACMGHQNNDLHYNNKQSNGMLYMDQSGQQQLSYLNQPNMHIKTDSLDSLPNNMDMNAMYNNRMNFQMNNQNIQQQQNQFVPCSNQDMTGFNQTLPPNANMNMFFNQQKSMFNQC